jgi:hypothetical protein
MRNTLVFRHNDMTPSPLSLRNRIYLLVLINIVYL